MRVSGNGRYFVDEDKRPAFWLGDTQWELFRLFTRADAAEVLRRRAEQGFSAIQVMVTGVGDGTKPNLAGQAPWEGDDPARPNEAYFRRADESVEDALDAGLVLVLGVYHQTQRERLTTANARAYARCVAERYADAPHVIWTTYPEAKPEYLPVMREVAAGLREGDGGAHLITCHPDPSVTSSSFTHGEEWLDFNMIQTCTTYERNAEMVAHDYDLTPPKPTVMAEGGYEGTEFGRTQAALEIRKQAYWSYLPGGHHSYGHNDNWVSPQTWREWIDSPGAQSMTVCRQVLEGLEEWWDLVPDPWLLADGPGSGLTQDAAARHGGGRWALVYLGGPGPVRVKMSGICAAGRVDAAWLDPATGGRTPIGAFPAQGVRTFAPPGGWQDALLLFSRPR
jgi:hypothetical protein